MKSTTSDFESIKGAASIEYALMISLILLASISAISRTGLIIRGQFVRAAEQMDTGGRMGGGLQGEGEGS